MRRAAKVANSSTAPANAVNNSSPFNSSLPAEHVDAGDVVPHYVQMMAPTSILSTRTRRVVVRLYKNHYATRITCSGYFKYFE